MIKRGLTLASLLVLGWATFASAQNAPSASPAFGVAGAYNASPLTCTNGQACWFQTDANGQLKVTGSFSSSVAGFAPVTTGTPISVTTGGVTGTLPAGAVVTVFNVGTTNTAYCKLGASSTTSDIAIPPASWFAYTVGAATQLTCITSTSTTTVNMVGGSGLPTGAGGGGGGSGGGTMHQGPAGASAWLVTGTGGTFPVTQSTSPWVVSNGGTFAAQINGFTSWAGGTLGAMANYGTSPGAVLAPGVNAFVTNTNANGANTAANSSPTVNATDQVNSTTGNIVANNTTAVVVNAAATTLYGVQVFGIGSAPAYLKLYNATSATCGSGTPVKRLMIPAAATAANGAGAVIPFSLGLRFSTGLTYCVTTGIADADTTAPAASTFLVNLDWR